MNKRCSSQSSKIIYSVHNFSYMYLCVSYQQHLRDLRPCFHGPPFLNSGLVQDGGLMPGTFLLTPHPAPALALLFLPLLPSPGAACSIYWTQPLTMMVHSVLTVECFHHSLL